MDELSREVQESPIYQGADEQIAYSLTTTPWGSDPSAVDVKLFRVTAGPTYTDVTSTNLNGTASVTGDVITTPKVQSLAANNTYQLEVKFTCSGNIFETFCQVRGQK